MRSKQSTASRTWKLIRISIITILGALTAALASCSLADVQEATHAAGVPIISGGTAYLVTGTPLTAAAVGAAAYGAEILLPTGRDAAVDQAVIDTVEAMTRGDVEDLLAVGMKPQKSWAGALTFFAIALGLYVLLRRRKGEQFYKIIKDLEEKVRDL